MAYDLAFRTALAAGLGLVAAAGNLVGGYFVVRQGLAAAVLAVFFGAGRRIHGGSGVCRCDSRVDQAGGRAVAAVFVLIGYFLVHLFEHTIAPHFHFGEETHSEEVSHHHARTTVLLGLTIHTFFDGVAIAAGFLVSVWLGSDDFRGGVFPQIARRVYGGVGGARERARAAQRNPRRGVIGSGNTAGSFAD